MFSHAAGRRVLVDRLRALVAAEQLPRVLALEAPSYSGKLTLALEIARMLCCEAPSASEECSCSTCTRCRQLTLSELMIIGERRFLPEILYAAERLRARYDEEMLLYMRCAVRKLLKRFDPALANPAHLKGLESTLERVETILSSLSDSLDDLDRMVASCRKLSRSPALAINMANIRNIITHSHYTSSVSRRVLIVENVHQIHESGANALLKLFEEPPENLYIICTLTQRQLLLPTVVSRLHMLRLPELSGEEHAVLMRDVLQNTEAESPRAFFLNRYYGFSLDRLAELLVREMSGEGKEFFPAFTERRGEADEKELFLDLLDLSAAGFSKRLQNADAQHVVTLKRRWRQLMHACRLMIQRRVGLASVMHLLGQSGASL